VRERLAKVDADAAALLGRIELEWQLLAILDLTAEKHAERGVLDQGIALRLCLAAE